MQHKSELTEKEKIEKLRKETFIEINKIDSEIRISRNKKIFVIGTITVVIFVIIKAIFGTIEINSIFGYPPNKARFYKLTINDKAITVDYNLKHSFPIIPFLINFNSNYLGSSNIIDDDNGTYFYPDDSEKYIIDISSYSCYRDSYQVECTNENQSMKKNNDTKYVNMTITRTNNPYEEVYNGEFIHDITPYVKKKGIYCVEVTGKYSLVETKIYFYFKR